MINAEDLVLMKIEYASQDRKIFLTKLEIPEQIHTPELQEAFLKVVLHHIQDLNVSVVPTSPPIAKFIRGNRKYKRMLPVGVRI